MKIQAAYLAMFSPTGSTKHILERMGARLAPAPAVMDLTLPPPSPAALHFTSSDLVIFGAPVYGGRIPETARKRFASLKGHRTPAAVIVTYGNRAYEDALLELKDLAQSQGFTVIAAAAFVTEHSIIRQIAAGRPDAGDLAAIDRFGDSLRETAAGYLPSAHRDLKVPGNPQYKTYAPIPMHPKAGSSCTGCGLCAAQCPVGAIDAANPRATDGSRCISCMRCIRVCPAGARKLPWLVMFAAKRKIMPLCRVRREPEVFF